MNVPKEESWNVTKIENLRNLDISVVPEVIDEQSVFTKTSKSNTNTVSQQRKHDELSNQQSQSRNS